MLWWLRAIVRDAVLSNPFLGETISDTLQGTITYPPKRLFESMVFLFPYGGICYLFLEGKSLSKSNHGMNHRTSWLGVAEWFLGRFCCETLDLWRTSPPQIVFRKSQLAGFHLPSFFLQCSLHSFLANGRSIGHLTEISQISQPRTVFSETLKKVTTRWAPAT